jgi:glycosyltransferase involved in cell wall biosynthesis
VIVPAHDEASLLPLTLERLHAALGQCGRDYELVVVDNASSDGTAEVAAARGAKVVHEAHRQISRARNTGARAGQGDYLLFVDADTWPSRELVANALALLDAGVCGGGALVAFDEAPNRPYRWGVDLWNGLSRRLRWAAGCFVFARRDAFEAVGGFDDRLYAGDEVALSRALRRWGGACRREFVIISAHPVVTSARKAQWFGPWQHLLALLLALFPPALRSRRLMWFWYRRP